MLKFWYQTPRCVIHRKKKTISLTLVYTDVIDFLYSPPVITSVILHWIGLEGWAGVYLCSRLNKHLNKKLVKEWYMQLHHACSRVMARYFLHYCMNLNLHIVAYSSHIDKISTIHVLKLILIRINLSPKWDFEFLLESNINPSGIVEYERMNW